MVRWRTSAAYRIAFTYSAAFALAILLSGAAVYFAADAEFRNQRDQSIIDESVTLARETDLDELRGEIATRERPPVREAFGYALFDRSGRRIAGSLDTPRPAPGLQTIIFEDPREGPDVARANAVPLAGGSLLVVALDSEAIESIDATILGLFGVAFAAVMAIGMVGAFLLGTYLRRRLGQIAGTARAIVGGDLANRVPIGPSNDEFDQAGQALNAMLDRIARLMENLRQVSSDVAHDLRTPLVRLRNQLELVGQENGAAERAIEQGDALLSLFASILRIAEVEGGNLAQNFTLLDLSSLTVDVCETYLPAIIDSGRSLRFSIAPDAKILGNRELLAQAIGNILDNARVHTPKGTQIDVALHSDTNSVEISVADNGPGVPAEDRDRILQRFVRGKASRTAPGNGLGLSLAAAAAKAHGGALTIGDNKPALRASIVIPRAGGSGAQARS